MSRAINFAVIGGTGLYKLAELDGVETHTSAASARTASPSWPATAKATRCRRTASTTAPTCGH